MKEKTAAIVAIFALAVGQFIMPIANAAGVQASLDQSNESSIFPSGTNYLSVAISEGVGEAIDFLVQTGEALSSIADSNYGIQSFSFNFGDSGATKDNLVLPSGWKVANGNGSHSVFGKFDVTLQGTGSSRQDPLMFSIVGVTGDSPADYIEKLSSRDALFAAHVAGFEMTGSRQGSGVTSAQFGGSSVVPIPAAVWLMFSALTVLGWKGRKSATNKAGAEETKEPAAA
jgi:hypothetical protein